MTVLCRLVVRLPIGTNLGLVQVLWMLVSGRLLRSRGALLPGLDDLGLPAPAVRRAWAAVGQGAWTSAELRAAGQQFVLAAGQWQPPCYEGYQPVAVDTTGFWRPRLQDCPTKHYHAAAGKALPAIPVGLIARIGRVQGQRLGLPVAFVRAERSEPSVSAHQRWLLEPAVAASGPRDVLVVDAGFRIAELQAGGALAWVVRLPKNITARRAVLPEQAGRGRPATHGTVVRPLARTYRGRRVAATPPAAGTTWQDGPTTVRAAVWTGLILPDTPAEPVAATFTVVALHDPRYTEPLLLATSLGVSAQTVWALYRERWPVEQLPLAAKQMIGAARQFVSAPETCQRLPELALLAGAILSYLAATEPAVPTGFWDRRPQPTPGRLRRQLARTPFPDTFPFPARIREKAAVTAHLPKGFWGQRTRSQPPTQPTPARQAA